MLYKTAKRKEKLKRLCAGAFTFFIALILSLSVQAQPTDPGQGDCGNSPDDICPIDNEVVLLVGLALFFGYRQIRKNKKALLIN